MRKKSYWQGVVWKKTTSSVPFSTKVKVKGRAKILPKDTTEFCEKCGKMLGLKEFEVCERCWTKHNSNTVRGRKNPDPDRYETVKEPCPYKSKRARRKWLVQQGSLTIIGGKR